MSEIQNRGKRCSALGGFPDLKRLHQEAIAIVITSLNDILERQRFSPGIDGGKVRIRSQVQGVESYWRDYKAVRLQGIYYGAFFQDNLSLSDWVNSQLLLFPLVCLGNGHDGVWNLFAEIGSTEMRQEILDWYHQCRKSLQGGWVDKTVKSCRKIVILKDTASHMARSG
jgi:hypothetical protein